MKWNEHKWKLVSWIKMCSFACVHVCSVCLMQFNEIKRPQLNITYSNIRWNLHSLWRFFDFGKSGSNRRRFHHTAWVWLQHSMMQSISLNINLTKHQHSSQEKNRRMFHFALNREFILSLEFYICAKWAPHSCNYANESHNIFYMNGNDAWAR